VYRYRNRNTGDEYESAEPNRRLEHLSNWDRIAQPETTPDETTPDEPGFDPAEHTVPDVLAYIEQADKGDALQVLDAEATGKQRAGVLAAREAVEAREG
jgi:hypothetical protein